MFEYLAITPVEDSRGNIVGWRNRSVIFADDVFDAIHQARALYGGLADVREVA